MKRKLLTLAAALTMALILAASAMAAGEILLGGWTAAEDPAVTAEIQNLVTLALEGMDEYECTPVAVLGSQVVAGTNYAVLCKGKAASSDAVLEWKIVYLYEDLEGNVTLLNIADFDFGGLCTYGADVDAQGPEAGWVRDGVDGAIWQDDRASLEIFLEDEDNFKVQISWASSAMETTEWVYACDYDAETSTLRARNVTCDDVVYNDAGVETRTVVYEKDSSEAVFSLNAEGKVVLTNAGDDALEGKTFEYIGNLDGDEQ